MEQGFTNFLVRATVANGVTKVYFQLIWTILRRKQNEGQQAASLTGEAWTGPDSSPPEFCDQFFKRPRELITVRQPLIYSISANNFSADLQAILISIYRHTSPPQLQQPIFDQD
jgi:hypothetical protein